MARYLVKEESLNEVLKYLAARPYAEVFKLIPALQIPAIEEEKVEEPKAE